MTENNLDPVVEEIIRLQWEFSQIGALSIWVVYDHPSDFADNVVARCWSTDTPTNHVVLATEINQLREIFSAAGLVCLQRNPNDEPAIVEVWL